MVIALVQTIFGIAWSVSANWTPSPVACISYTRNDVPNMCTRDLTTIGLATTDLATTDLATIGTDIAKHLCEIEACCEDEECCLEEAEKMHAHLRSLSLYAAGKGGLSMRARLSAAKRAAELQEQAHSFRSKATNHEAQLLSILNSLEGKRAELMSWGLDDYDA